MHEPKARMEEYWESLYPDANMDVLKIFIKKLDEVKGSLKFPKREEGWYKDAIVYSLYVDLFNEDFPGLERKLDYLKDLGVNCLWLLPILDSPGRDAGFDISDYQSIRPDLLGVSADATKEEKTGIFARFLENAHQRGIHVIFDIAINHTSEEHPWFLESKKSTDNPFHDYYIWANDNKGYADARIIFEGLCESNWQKEGDQFFFHRFFEFQPDLNYRNPEVLLAMVDNLVFWLNLGVDGFRADAIPYLWKEEGTDCENLPQTHLIVKFFRAVLDYLRPDTLLLAEACQKPVEVVKYFGDGDECHAGYHFPLMPQMFKSLNMQSSVPVADVLRKSVTPEIPESCQWFTFLRCHDELSLELVYVTEEDRKYIHENYCKQPEWNFRLGQGVAARLAELFDRDPDKIALAYAMMLSLPGTPVIYYGDEFGKLNDHDYYREMIKLTGKDDTRFLVRGRLNWAEVEASLEDKNSFHAKVYHQIKNMINTRKMHPTFGRGNMSILNIFDGDGKASEQVMAYYRAATCNRILIMLNLSDQQQKVQLPTDRLKNYDEDMLGQKILINEDETLSMAPFQYYWFFV